MAEIDAVVADLEPIPVKLGDAIIKLEKFLQVVKADLGFVDYVESLFNELKWIQAFLLDAEKMPGSRDSNLFQSLVSAVEQLATECDSFADKINLKAFEQPKMSYTGCLSLSCCIFYQTKFRPTHELRVQVKKLLSEIHGISSRQVCHEDENLVERRQTAPYANNEHMVGQDETIKDLTTKLLNKDSDQFVMYIVGMSGLGKTALAKKLFNTLSEEHFKSCAWVCVSKEHNTQDMLMSLINSMTTPSRNDWEALTTVISMEAFLQKSLSDRRFLVVIDDVWDREVWESLERAFPKNNNGSKVIITTRNEPVVASNNVYVHKLRYLDENESWELFCRKALPHGIECPSDLNQIGKQMVANCSGLPLAIEVLGGMLFTKSLALSEWEVVRDNIWKELKKNSVLINKSDLHHNDKLKGKNKNKLSEIDSISSGESSYDLNADINSAISAMESLGIKLGDVLPKLSNFFRDKEDDLDIEADVVTLEKELKLMQKGFKDLEIKPDKDISLLKTWVKDVSKLAIEGEPVVDQITSLTQEETKTDLTESIRILSTQIKELLVRSKDLSTMRTHYDSKQDVGNTSVGKSEDETFREVSRSASFDNNEQMIIHLDTINDLSAKLTNGDSGQFFISIVGMGGIGKTTIARTLFNTLSSQHFTYSVWVSVSKEYNIREILMSLINSLTAPSQEDRRVFASINLMIPHLRKYLSDHRCLVAIDDVRDLEIWEILQRVYPKNNNGSKVIITTRNETMVVASNNVYVHKLRCLDEHESWALFCRKALSHGTKCSSKLKQVGKQMVAKCLGLPLAIEALGAILLKKPLNLSEWEVVRYNLYTELKDFDHINKTDIEKILSAIYGISSGESSYNLNADINSAISAVESLDIKLGEVLPKVRNFFRDKEDDLDIEADVVTLEKELKLIQKGFKDLEIKPDKDISLLKTWVKDVRKLAIEGEHIISLTQEATKTDLMESTRKFRAQIKELLVRSKDISYIKEKQNCYNPNADVASPIGVVNNDKIKLLERRKDDSYACGDEHVVGLRETIEDLTTKLIDRTSRHFLISILGMGGLGKTTLARKLYNTMSQDSFESRAWICVSQQFNTQELLMELINSMTTPSNQDRKAFISIPAMEIYLRKYLMNRRFLVVVDDIWERDAWESMKRALPDNKNNGSKVIITTRIEEVAAMNNAYVHKLRYLDKDESWDLFCRKALPRDAQCPSNLEQIGREMVAKCSGLPLAIIILGGILSRKSLLFSKWQIVKDNLWKELKKDSIHISDILTLSFEDLPEHLKQCFLYVAMFPEDFEIDRSKLMLLWEAEGFIEKGEEGYVGDATKLYFEELVGRSLFFKTGGDWIDSTFRVHGLLRDLAITKSREMSISIFYDGKRTVDISKAPSHRRITVFHPHNDIPVEYTNTSLHTFIFWESINNATLHGLIRTLPEKFQNLRVLNVSCTFAFEGMLNSIGDMIHLRFLGFQYTSMPTIFEIPNTIGNLKALQTLSISGGLVRIPKTVLEKLTQLKHLIGNFEFSTDEIGSLVSLETLTGITGEQWCRLDTTNLVKLRRLTLRNIKKVEDIFYDNFRKLERLQTLSLSPRDELDISLEKIFELCPSISHLKTGKISFHNSLNLDRFAKNLVVVECVLGNTTLRDTISLFGRLPQLEALNLNIWPIRGKVRVDKGFAQLRFLKIIFKSSAGFVVSEDCMPLVEHLEIDDPSKIQGPARMMRLLNR